MIDAEANTVFARSRQLRKSWQAFLCDASTSINGHPYTSNRFNSALPVHLLTSSRSGVGTVLDEVLVVCLLSSWLVETPPLPPRGVVQVASVVWFAWWSWGIRRHMIGRGASANRELGRVYNLRYLLIFFGTLLTEFIQCSRGRRYSEHHHDRSYEVRFHVGQAEV